MVVAPTVVGVDDAIGVAVTSAMDLDRVAPASLAVSSSSHAHKTNSPTRTAGENRCALQRSIDRTVAPFTQTVDGWADPHHPYGPIVRAKCPR